jgi:methyl-accepting chemotaxis protein
MTALMKRLAGGDTSVRAAAILQKDEVGDMARAVEIFREGMIESVRLGAAHHEE